MATGVTPASMLTTPTFVIGLGGIGNQVARLVRTRYLASNRVLPDTVRIRSIDTANQNPDEAIRPLPDSMFTKLGEFQATQVVQRLDLHPSVARWWKYPAGAFAPGYIANGAGAKRPVGRLVFFHQFTKVHAALQEDLSAPLRSEVQARLIEQQLGPVRKTARVFIVGSLAGGTCAGLFLDVAFLTRHLLRQLGYDDTGSQIVGILGLPSVIHLASGDAGTAQARQRETNAAAALGELDFLIHHWPNNLQLDYPNPVGAFSPRPPLYDQVFLFTASKLAGVTFSRQADVLRRVAHFVFGQVALGMGEQTLQVLDNFKRYFDPAERAVVDGLPAVYGAFGVEWLEVPHSRLLPAWVASIAEAVGKKVGDFAWQEQPKQNLERTILERFLPSDEALRGAFDAISSSPDTVLTIPGLPDLGPLFLQIQSATKKEELKNALSAFDAQLPSQVEALRKRFRVRSAGPDEESRVRGLAAELIADPKFRVGGARRVLEHAADMLARLSTAAASGDALEDVLLRCGGGLLKHLNVAPALSWAKQRVLDQVRGSARGELSGRATRLGGVCRDWAGKLDVLQQAVKSGAPQLAESRPGADPDAAEDTWLLTDQDIASSITQNRESVTDAVVDSVCHALAAFVRDGDLPADGLRESLQQSFVEEALKATERESARFVRRPLDAFDRIRNRVQTCEPMAHIITSGNEMLEVMSEGARATPLKLVLTGMDRSDRTRLEEWAKSAQQRGGDESAFQVIPSNDAFRDDALHLTFGWPLWLFREVQACVRAAEVAITHDSNAGSNARVLREVEGAVHHAIRPLSDAEARLSFAFAVVLGHVRPLRLDRIEFASDMFPGQSDAGSLADALRRFRQQGLNRHYRNWLDEQQRGDPRAFVDRLKRGIERLTAALENPAAVPPGLRPELEACATQVETELGRIVLL